MALTDRLSAYKGVVEQLVSHFGAESDASIYSESYEKLSNWVDNALDMYRVRFLSSSLYNHFPGSCTGVCASTGGDNIGDLCTG